MLNNLFIYYYVFIDYVVFAVHGSALSLVSSSSSMYSTVSLQFTYSNTRVPCEFNSIDKGEQFQGLMETLSRSDNA